MHNVWWRIIPMTGLDISVRRRTDFRLDNFIHIWKCHAPNPANRPAIQNTTVYGKHFSRLKPVLKESIGSDHTTWWLRITLITTAIKTLAPGNHSNTGVKASLQSKYNQLHQSGTIYSHQLESLRSNYSPKTVPWHTSKIIALSSSFRLPQLSTTQ